MLTLRLALFWLCLAQRISTWLSFGSCLALDFLSLSSVWLLFVVSVASTWVNKYSKHTEKVFKYLRTNIFRWIIIFWFRRLCVLTHTGLNYSRSSKNIPFSILQYFLDAFWTLLTEWPSLCLLTYPFQRAQSSTHKIHWQLSRDIRLRSKHSKRLW